jgi:hypothetical protein
VWDKWTCFDGTSSRADFVFDQERSVYICPGGKLLHTTGTVIDGGTLRYRASKRACDICALKLRCSPSTPARQIPRDLHEDARDVAHALAKTQVYEQSGRERKKVEMRFAAVVCTSGSVLLIGSAAAAGLTGAQLQELLTGKSVYLENTAASTAGAGQGVLHYAADGTALYKTGSGRVLHGTWIIKDNTS